MKSMNKILAIAFATILVFSYVSVAEATHNPAGDRYVNVDAGNSNVQPNGKGCEASKNAIDNARKNGPEMEYSYIWVYVNGTCVAVGDPPRAFY